jgi:predicted anti-sigma-YlaC factor YlaD
VWASRSRPAHGTAAYCFDGALFAGALVDFVLLGELVGLALVDAAFFGAVFLWCFLWCFLVVGFAAGFWVACAFVGACAGAGFVCTEFVAGFVCAAKASDPDINTTVSAVVILFNIESSCPDEVQIQCRRGS